MLETKGIALPLVIILFAGLNGIQGQYYPGSAGSFVPYPYGASRYSPPPWLPYYGPPAGLHPYPYLPGYPPGGPPAAARPPAVSTAPAGAPALPVTKLKLPIVAFNKGDVIDYEYFYDSLPEVEERGVIIIPMKKKSNATSPGVPTTTSAPRRTVKPFVASTVRSTTKRATTTWTVVKTTTQKPEITTAKASDKPVFRPPKFELPEEETSQPPSPSSVSPSASEEDEDYDDNDDYNRSDESSDYLASKSMVETTTAQSKTTSPPRKTASWFG